MGNFDTPDFRIHYFKAFPPAGKRISVAIVHTRPRRIPSGATCSSLRPHPRKIRLQTDTIGISISYTANNKDNRLWPRREYSAEWTQKKEPLARLLLRPMGPGGPMAGA